MRLDSPFVLAAAGTFAIHLILVVTFDAVTVLNPYQPAPPAPRVEMIDVEVPPPPEPPKPPPPPVAKEPEPEPEPVKTAPDPKPRPKVAARQETTPPPSEDTPPPIQDDPAPTGGDEVVQMEDIAPAARGVAVKPGKPNKGNIGRGGSGGGTGAGSGSGTADAPAPVSVATIKKAAMPKGDYGYFNTDEYPAAAKQLGIEGPIRVRLIVDTEGKVKQATLLNKLGHGLDEMALGRAKQIKFDPALDSLDRPVTSVVVWTFHMTLPK
jgi:periplasmic protein TonB